MSNWAANPANQRESLLTSSVAPLAFVECQKYCIGDVFAPPAFNLSMAVHQRAAARQNFRSYVDVSRFTGMEIEHKHDTESVISHENDGHVHPKSVQDFTEIVGKSYGNIQEKALK